MRCAYMDVVMNRWVPSVSTWLADDRLIFSTFLYILYASLIAFMLDLDLVTVVSVTKNICIKAIIVIYML
jgi:hypothetical protein